MRNDSIWKRLLFHCGVDQEESHSESLARLLAEQKHLKKLKLPSELLAAPSYLA